MMEYKNFEVEYRGDKHNLAFGKSKIKNGSKFIIGGELAQFMMTVHQHFNWFQKLMWKWLFGVKIEDYSEE